MSRAQCLVVRNNKILMVKHHDDKNEWWCLPGGGIEKKETPQQAALRELKEECRVNGKIVKLLSYQHYNNEAESYSYLVDIGNSEPELGSDPEFPLNDQAMIDMKWLSLWEIPERDRCYLWAAGLIGIPGMVKEVECWGNEISYPLEKEGSKRI